MASWFRRAKAAYAAYTAPRADGAASRPITAEEAELHITPELLTYVTELVRMPQTWRQFPLVALLEEDGIDTAGLVLPSQKDPPGETDRLESPVPLLLTLAQVRHGECILARSPALSEFRMRLCPRYMGERGMAGMVGALNAAAQTTTCFGRFTSCWFVAWSRFHTRRTRAAPRPAT